MSHDLNLSRRERQIMDALHSRTEATAAEILASIPDPPGYSAVRALLRILEEKGHIKHREEGSRYVYFPNVSRQVASRSALKRLVSTFFDGSPVQAIAALLEDGDALSERELRKLQEMISKARKEGR